MLVLPRDGLTIRSSSLLLMLPGRRSGLRLSLKLLLRLLLLLPLVLVVLLRL